MGRNTSAVSHFIRLPLLHFLVVATAIGIIYTWLGDVQAVDPDRTIQITADDVSRLVVGWQARWNRPPTPEELDGLVNARIREIAPYREALVMGLDEDDQVIRRVLGQKLETCGTHPVTGFYRNGCCDTGPEDHGVHTVCVVMTDEFLEFSRRTGNDLSTPHLEFGFPGLRAGDRWCLCAERWREAHEAGMAPGVILQATHERTLEHVPLARLSAHAVDEA